LQRGRAKARTCWPKLVSHLSFVQSHWPIVSGRVSV